MLQPWNFRQLAHTLGCQYSHTCTCQLLDNHMKGFGSKHALGSSPCTSPLNDRKDFVFDMFGFAHTTDARIQAHSHLCLIQAHRMCVCAAHRTRVPFNHITDVCLSQDYQARMVHGKAALDDLKAALDKNPYRAMPQVVKAPPAGPNKSQQLEKALPAKESSAAVKASAAKRLSAKQAIAPPAKPHPSAPERPGALKRQRERGTSTHRTYL